MLQVLDLVLSECRSQTPFNRSAKANPLDPELPTSHPEFINARPIKVEIKAGEILFLPMYVQQGCNLTYRKKVLVAFRDFSASQHCRQLLGLPAPALCKEEI
jgi:hypothetical protein